MKVIVVLGGDPPGSVLLEWRLKQADFSIAADAGMTSFVEAGLEPDLLIGDMDSFNLEDADLVCETQRIDDQENTDFQKALARPELQDAGEVVILGGTGGRSDHFISNLLIAAALPNETAVLFEANLEIIHRVTPERPLTLQGLNGLTISLIPLGDCQGVTATGLRWPLEESDMGVGGQLSQSNLGEGDELRVNLASGILYVIVGKR